jgi:sigma-B regulation protein RsbU (phosphoserine phosphatase)
MNVEAGSVLIVDDEELNREGLARHLQRHGFAVTLARNGREAIDLLGGRRFDLVLLDIMMPGMNGLEVLKFLRRVDSLLDLPIIMVSAKGESEDMVEALELGANDYVTKPLDLPVVLARIRSQLALRRAVSQVTELERKLDARNQDLEAAAAELEATNERVSQDLEAAARIQQALLPTSLPEAPGARFAWAFKPCRLLAGDFLNVFPLGARHLGLCVLDANGQGAAAALLAAASGHLLARLAGPAQPGSAPGPPGEVVGRLGRQLAVEATARQPLTLIYGILGLNTRELRYVSAGHPAPVHLPRGAAPDVLEGSGLPVGVGAGDYREHTVKLQPGDRLVLYSDGVTEARNADGSHFGTRRLLSELERTRHAPLEESLRGVLAELERWRGDNPRQDDVAILAVEMTEAEPPRRAAAPA